MDQESLNCEVNYLLSVVRMPIHFYGMVNNLTGRDAIYRNPGISLRTFVIAKLIDHEMCTIAGDMFEVFKECERFTNSNEIFTKIIDMLLKNVVKLMNTAVDLSPEMQLKVAMRLNQMNDLSKKIVEAINEGKGGSDLALREMLFSLHEIILDTSWEIADNVPTLA